MKAKVKSIPLKVGFKTILKIFLGSNRSKHLRQTSQDWRGLPVGYTKRGDLQ